MTAMQTYRVTLELRSGLGTPLAAETIWGHLAWGIRYCDGEPALVDWLNRYDTDQPPLVLSDPLPAGYFPRPLLPRPPRPGTPPTPAEAERRKRAEKRSWLPHEAWNPLRDRLSSHSLSQALAEATPPPEPVDASHLHAAVNRLTGGTAQVSGGTLFQTDQQWYGGAVRFDVWALSPEPSETVRGWFEAGLAGGYGRDAAAGSGHLVVQHIESAGLPSVERPNAVVLLGSAVPRPGDPCRGFFSVGVRSGRVGGEFSIGPLPDGSNTRQKRPVRCLQAGTLLALDAAAPEFVGRLLSNVHPTVPEIRHYGLSPVLPCRLEAAVLNEALSPLAVLQPHPGNRS